MRTTFLQTLLECAAADERIWLLNGDLGYSVLEPFADRFPDRYVNAGVAEQNMTGMAAGLAHSGKIVFTYSIANFPVFRCLEQIRNDVCYHNLPVNVVSVGAGLAYGGQGYSHHGIEDMAAMRVLPYITVMSPADPLETRLATRRSAEGRGPSYLRLGKAGEPVIHTEEMRSDIGKALPLRWGSGGTIITTGSVLRLAVAAADQLAASGRSVTVLSVPTIQPLDEETVVKASAGSPVTVTVEEHGAGGLASAVAETLCLHRVTTSFHALRLPREPMSVAGTHEQLLRRAGLTTDNIVRAVLEG